MSFGQIDVTSLLLSHQTPTLLPLLLLLSHPTLHPRQSPAQVPTHMPLRCCHLWMKVKVPLIGLDHKRCTSMILTISPLLRSRGYGIFFPSSLRYGKIASDGLLNPKRTGYTSRSRTMP